MANDIQQLENQVDAIGVRVLEDAIQALKEKSANRVPTAVNMAFRSLFTLNPVPGRKFRRHLKKAKIAPSPEKAIASDWAKVSSDLYMSFLIQALEVKQNVE